MNQKTWTKTKTYKSQHHKKMQIEEEETKLSLFADYKIVHEEPHTINKNKASLNK